MELEDRAGNVRTRQDLAELLGLLAQDCAQHGDEWENPTLERYLEAMAAWVASMASLYRNRGQEPPESPSWELCARMLLAARNYE
ncbi:hypothetical protein GCM10012275_16080 [Longimycelium tulufanense]|uniref:DUF7660 domain-containing protein n=1 Tax=Longimycelium tulufanense TaxID=907463 RepID=A0A8J3CCF3_9PSEU|nr:hypothetical protein [Longimycelium tulufanense]GGM45862.1 hypothetical protein GCM10012275_16080 [Longimycelium tulufanense]